MTFMISVYRGAPQDAYRREAVFAATQAHRSNTMLSSTPSYARRDHFTWGCVSRFQKRCNLVPKKGA